MGWGGGSQVIRALQTSLIDNVPDVGARVSIYSDMLDELRDMDWDNEEECTGFDEAYDAVVYISRFITTWERYGPPIDEDLLIEMAENAWNESEDWDAAQDALEEIEVWKDSL